MGLSTKENDKMVKNKDTVFNSGPMAQDMKVTGRMTKQMVMGGFCMQMEMSMKEIGVTTRHMGKERISIQMEHNTQEIGLRISSMDKVLRHGLMVHAMKATTKMVKKMAMAL